MNPIIIFIATVIASAVAREPVSVGLERLPQPNLATKIAIHEPNHLDGCVSEWRPLNGGPVESRVREFNPSCK